MNDEKKVGVLHHWNDGRGFGIVRVGDRSSLERYFLHVSKIKSGTATPERGMAVRFRVSTKPPAEGQLPQAVDADIDVSSIKSTQESDGVGGAA